MREQYNFSTFTDDLTLVADSVILTHVSEVDAVVTVQSVPDVTGHDLIGVEPGLTRHRLTLDPIDHALRTERLLFLGCHALYFTPRPWGVLVDPWRPEALVLAWLFGCGAWGGR